MYTKPLPQSFYWHLIRVGSLVAKTLFYVFEDAVELVEAVVIDDEFAAAILRIESHRPGNWAHGNRSIERLLTSRVWRPVNPLRPGNHGVGQCLVRVALLSCDANRARGSCPGAGIIRGSSLTHIHVLRDISTSVYTKPLPQSFYWHLIRVGSLVAKTLFYVFEDAVELVEAVVIDDEFAAAILRVVNADPRAELA